MTAKQVKELQRRLAQLEEENLILKKRLPSSRHTQTTTRRGTQYTAFTFRQLLDSLNVVPPFSKKGYPFDNACCECFFKYLKKEEVNRKTYHSLQELQLSVFEYIEEFYNAKRPHSSLRMMTPNEKEEWYWAQL